MNQYRFQCHRPRENCQAHLLSVQKTFLPRQPRKGISHRQKNLLSWDTEECCMLLPDWRRKIPGLFRFLFYRPVHTDPRGHIPASCIENGPGKHRRSGCTSSYTPLRPWLPVLPQRVCIRAEETWCWNQHDAEWRPSGKCHCGTRERYPEGRVAIQDEDSDKERV